MALKYQHLEKIEKNAGLLGVLIAIMVALGGLAEITPIFIKAHAVEPAPGYEPYDPLRLAGKGEAGMNGGPAGDLYVVTRVAPSPVF